MTEKASFLSINHVALDFYGRLLDSELRGRTGKKMAFLDAGDQFIAISAPDRMS